MSILARAGKNIFFKAVAEILSRFVYLFFFIYMARKLGAADFGLFSFAFSLASIFAILVEPGLNTLLMRNVSKDHALARQYSDNIFTIKTLLSIATFLLLLAYVKLMGYDTRTINAILTMGVFLLLNGFLDFFVAITNAHERMDIEAIIRVMNKLFVSVVGATALVLGSTLNGLLGWMVAGSSAAVLVSFFLMKRVIAAVGMAFEWRLIRSMLVQAYPLALTMIFYIMYFKIDVVMLSLFHVDNTQIGYYSASIRLIETLNLIPAILVGGIFPILANLHDTSRTELLALFSKAFKVLLLIAIPLVVLTSFFSKEIIDVIYGSDYRESASALVVVIWTSLFIFPNILLLNMLIIANKQRMNALFALICLLTNIGLNLVLIPRYGFLGASAATVATDALLLVISGYFASSHFAGLNIIHAGLKPVLCGVLLMLFLFALQDVNFAYALPIGIASYLILLFLTKTLSREDLLLFKKATAIT